MGRDEGFKQKLRGMRVDQLLVCGCQEDHSHELDTKETMLHDILMSLKATENLPIEMFLPVRSVASARLAMGQSAAILVVLSPTLLEQASDLLALAAASGSLA